MSTRMVSSREVVLSVWLAISMISGCSYWGRPQPVSRPPQTPLTVEESLQLWKGNCAEAKQTGCLFVRVTSEPNETPVSNAIVIIEGPGGMAGKTDENGEYRWSRIAIGMHLVSVTLLNGDSSVKHTEQQEIAIISGTISDISFKVP